AHLARAALEAIAHQVADLVEAMESDSGVRLSELRVDGGAARNDLLLQLQADFLGIPVVRPAMTETTAFGAAALAGLAVGFWESLDALAFSGSEERRSAPRSSPSRTQELRARWKSAVERARAWEPRTP